MAVRDPLLVVILGPTGSGKTFLSVELAARFAGEIVNCDSVALYREFNIGTAKPSLEDRKRVPHHLFDVIEPTHYTTAGEYARRARLAVRDIAIRDGLPIVVGGTGLYLRALIDGLFPGPERSEQLRSRLRERAQEKGLAYLHLVLRRLDTDAARTIHENDVPKIIRAIEVSLSAKQPMTEEWRKGKDTLEGFRVLRIGLDPARMELYQRINDRVVAMFAAGLVEETRMLLLKYGESARALSSIGYKQVVQLLHREFTLESAISGVQQAHRNYAKRQMTWFRKEPNVIWMNGFGDHEGVITQALQTVEQNL